MKPGLPPTAVAAAPQPALMGNDETPSFAAMNATGAREKR